MRAMKLREEHGMCGTRVYNAWAAMRARCENPTDRAYANYGGRGISICPEWKSFARFLSDMGEPQAGQSLDRIDNDQGYAPQNCRWASRQQQNRNQRRNRLITARGETKLLCEWASDLGISHHAILMRIKLGWSEEDAVTTPRVTKRAGIKRGERVKDHQEYGDRHRVRWSDPKIREPA